jgi:hypothetical protein
MNSNIHCRSDPGYNDQRMRPCYSILTFLFPSAEHSRDYAAPDAFAFSCSSSFLRAARIISSRRLCRFACLSLLSALHDFAFGRSSCVGCETWLSFEDKLYRVMRSGCAGLAGVGAARVGAGAVRGAGVGIWKDAGACL